MNYERYRLKVQPRENRSVYRILEIGGNRSFADLSRAILKAFDFDEEHLYMFSLSQKPYDPQGIYHPMEEEKNKADKVRILDVQLTKKKKILYLYDFGDDWMFDITVEDKQKSDRNCRTKVLEAQGELEQYLNYEDWEGEASAGEFLVIEEEAEDKEIRDQLCALPALMKRM